MITATLSMFATGITPSLEVFAEEQAQQKKVSTTLQNENSVNVENRVFAVPGKGDVSQLQNIERRERNFSAYEPTGLYAKPNEQITIQVQGTTFTDQNLTANKEYKYAVKAVDATGNTSIQSNILPIKTKDQNVSYEKWNPKKAYTKGDKLEHQGKVYEAVQNYQENGDPN